MKKSFFKITLFLLFISFLFTGCEGLWKDIADIFTCPISSIYVYPDGDYYFFDDYKSYPMTEGDTVDFVAEIEKLSKNQSVKYYIESDDEDVVKVISDSPVDSAKDKIKFTLEAVGKGEADVKIYVDGYKGSYSGCDTLTVDVAAKKTVYITDTYGVRINQLKIYKNKKVQLKAQNNYDRNSVKWSSSNSRVASVDSNGLVTAKDSGTATITLASYDSTKKSYCDVTVINPSDWKIEITNGNGIPTRFYPGDSYTLEYVVSGTDLENKSVSWKSTNTNVALIDASGKIKAISEGTTDVYATLNEYDEVKSNRISVTVLRTPIACNQFFWGKWIRMDNGKTYEVEENLMRLEGREYNFLEVNDNYLKIDTLGTFTKEQDSDRILIWHDEYNDIDIPLYRQGGTNLKYKLRIVGFEDEIGSSSNIGRAAGTGNSGLKGKGGLKVKGQSEKYPDYNHESETDEDGYVILEAPVQGDVETITIDDEENNEVIVVPGLRIDNDGANMGVIPIVGKDDYSLKITGTVVEGNEEDGYLYAGANNKYLMELTITNISSITSASSSCNIYSNDPNVVLEKMESSQYELDKVGISQLNPGATKKISFYVSYKDFTQKCIDTEIQIEVTNARNKRKWIDYVPLRFFKEQIPVTIAAIATEEENKTAALNGFLIYPDGNSKFFAVKTGTDKTVYIPSFDDSDGNVCKMVFCGATTTGTLLQDSTEMFYSVAFNKTQKKQIDLDMIEYSDFGEPNEKESEAYSITEDFEAYLWPGDIDFYNIKIDY